MSEKFSYEYTVPTEQERKEIESIKAQYLPKTKQDEKIKKLRMLDNKVKKTPIIFSLTMGIIGTLIFGLGMCFYLEWIDYFYFGIPFSVIGILLISLAYPIHLKITNMLKTKYKDQIINLSNELLGIESINED